MCKGGKEYLRLDECGLKMMSGELEGSETTSKITNKPRISKRVARLVSYGTYME